MKRTFAFLLVLMLLCPAALADTVREQVNAPLEHKERTVAPRADPIFMWTLRSSCRKRKQSRSTRRLPAYPTKWNLNCWRTLRLERAGIRWKEAKRTQATPAGVTYAEGDPAETANGLCLYSIDTGLFYGDREFRDGYYDFDNQSVFTINAMDGTVIDREYVY